MPQSFADAAEGANTTLGAVNEQAPTVFAIAKEVVGATHPLLKPLVVALEEIHKRCVGVKSNENQCRALYNFCRDIVAAIDESVKDGLVLNEAKHVDRLYKIFTQTAADVQAIGTYNWETALIKQNTVKETITALRIQLTDGFTAFNISSLLALQTYNARFEAAAEEDRRIAAEAEENRRLAAEATHDKLDYITEQTVRILDAVTSDVRGKQLRLRTEPSGSAEQATVAAELCNVLQQTGYPPLPLVDLFDEAKTVGDTFVSDGPNGTLWRGILLNSNDDPQMQLALKFPRNPIHLSPNRAREFNRSVEIQRGLKHRNISPLVGVKYKQSGDGLIIEFVALPWIKYGNVSSFLKKFPDADRLKLMLDVARGLKYLHEQSPPIAHRAIEPSHILVDAEKTAILANISVAKALDNIDSTTYSVSDGSQKSLRWMAPEVSDGECDTPADVYSWAMTSLSVLSEVDPFPDLKQPGAVVLAVGSKNLRPDRKQHPSDFLTPKMWELLERCWHQEPAKRPTMGDVVNEITSAIRPDLSVV